MSSHSEITLQPCLPGAFASSAHSPKGTLVFQNESSLSFGAFGTTGLHPVSLDQDSSFPAGVEGIEEHAVDDSGDVFLDLHHQPADRQLFGAEVNLLGGNPTPAAVAQVIPIAAAASGIDGVELLQFGLHVAVRVAGGDRQSATGVITYMAFVARREATPVAVDPFHFNSPAFSLTTSAARLPAARALAISLSVSSASKAVMRR